MKIKKGDWNWEERGVARKSRRSRRPRTRTLLLPVQPRGTGAGVLQSLALPLTLQHVICSAAAANLAASPRLARLATHPGAGQNNESHYTKESTASAAAHASM